MTTLGSLLGCFVLYGFARRGGEVLPAQALQRRRASNRGLALYQRHGLLAVVVPSLLPPPVPFKLFVLLAGRRACLAVKFGAAVAIGRGIRYFGQGYLAVLYGERAVALVQRNGPLFGVGLAVLAIVAGVIYFRWQRGSTAAPPSRTDDTPSTPANS